MFKTTTNPLSIIWSGPAIPLRGVQPLQPMVIQQGHPIPVQRGQPMLVQGGQPMLVQGGQPMLVQGGQQMVMQGGQQMFMHRGQIPAYLCRCCGNYQPTYGCPNPMCPY